MRNISIDNMLSQLGITSKDAQKTARNALFENNIIQKNPNRPNIACNKVDRARQALSEHFSWHCNNGDCRREAVAENTVRPLLLVEQRACQICDGNPSAKALRSMAQIVAAANKPRILIVGGTERKEREILGKCSGSVQWRFIDGKKARDDRYFRSHRNWADIIVIWQSTPMGHRVSSHFDCNGDSRVIAAPRRGIDCLTDEIIRHCRAR